MPARCQRDTHCFLAELVRCSCAAAVVSASSTEMSTLGAVADPCWGWARICCCTAPALHSTEAAQKAAGRQESVSHDMSGNEMTSH